MTKTIKQCRCCGKDFDATGRGGIAYCSDECRTFSQRERSRESHRIRYREKRKSKPKRIIPCRRCGAEFVSTWNQAYCPKCIMNPYDEQMKKYRGQRTRDP